VSHGPEGKSSGHFTKAGLEREKGALRKIRARPENHNLLKGLTEGSFFTSNAKYRGKIPLQTDKKVSLGERRKVKGPGGRGCFPKYLKRHLRPLSFVSC